MDCSISLATATKKSSHLERASGSPCSSKSSSPSIHFLRLSNQFCKPIISSGHLSIESNEVAVNPPVVGRVVRLTAGPFYNSYFHPPALIIHDSHPRAVRQPAHYICPPRR